MEGYPKSDFSDYSVGPASRTEADPFVLAHYLHRWPGVVVLTLGMWHGPFIVGVIVFALPPRETMKRYKVSLAWELARLYVMDSEPFNSETWFMSRAIKFVRSNHPAVEALVSYADPSAGHTGVIYRAANWLQDGRTDQDARLRASTMAWARRFIRAVLTSQRERKSSESREFLSFAMCIISNTQGS